MPEEFYLTKKKRKLKGKRLETFNQFWEIFNYKKGRAEAADAWLDIAVLTDAIVSQIFLAAKVEATRRPRLIEAGRTPKMAQGWITARRWEDETGDVAETQQAVRKPTSYENLVRAYNVLCACGMDKFEEFCKGVRLDFEDRERALNKYKMIYSQADVNNLANRAVRGV